MKLNLNRTRMDIRLLQTQREFIAMACDVLGVTFTHMLLQSAIKKAEDVLGCKYSKFARKIK